MFILAMSVPAFAADVEFDLTKGTSFVISNEGGLIDKLIKEGYGDYNLYQVLKVLQPYSNGVISDAFLTVLASRDPESEIFTAKLSTFAGANNPVAVNIDGVLLITDIYGKDFIGKTGFNTTPDVLSTNGQQLFTYATGTDYYIDSGLSTEEYSGGIITTVSTYHVFAIAWSMPTSIVLSNEGGLIDEMVAAGYGAYSLYDTLVALQPQSGGVITDTFLKALKYSPSTSEVFTAKLSAYAPDDYNPICINSDGTTLISDIYGSNYYGDTGYKTYKAIQAGVGRIKFTSPESSGYFIDTGVDSGEYYSGTANGVNYKAIGVIWSK